MPHVTGFRRTLILVPHLVRGDICALSADDGRGSSGRKFRVGCAASLPNFVWLALEDSEGAAQEAPKSYCHGGDGQEYHAEAATAVGG